MAGPNQLTVAILHCGDMGAALGRLLRETGVRVVTTCENRTHATEERAHASEIERLPGLSDVVDQSDIAISLVLPHAAVEMAREYADCHQRLSKKNSIFVDANSVGLDALRQVERVMAEREIPLVDAAIHGGAHRLQEVGVLYLSGPSAGRVEDVCRGAVRVDHLGEQVGAATGIKLVLAGLSKTLAAMFLEIGVLAERTGILRSFLDNCHHFYPGVMDAVERTIPTYPRHAARRVGEVRDIVKLADSSGSPARLMQQAGDLIEIMASIDWDPQIGPSPDLQTIIRSLAEVSHSQSSEGHIKVGT